MKENDKIAKAQKQLEEILSDPEVRRGIERREEAKTLEVLDFNCALERGEKKGIEKEKIEIAKEMLREGMEIEQIERITKLTQKEIEKLQKDEEKDNER